MKKMLIMAACLLTGAITFTSCDDDDDDDKKDNGSTIVTDAKYKDKSYGQAAIDACADVVTQLERANTAMLTASLTEEQESYLRNVLSNLVNKVIIPTYTELADDVEDLEKTLNGLTASNITQSQINKACDDFKDARENWERSEAFLMGAASDFDVDPTIDSWPLNRTLLLNYFNRGMNEEMLEDATILGFHALEFILFRNGQPRKVSEFQGNDSYKNFNGVSGAKELAYAQVICTLLKQRCFQLQVAWEGETSSNAARMQVVRGARLDYATELGLPYGQNLINAGSSNSTFRSLKAAISQVLSDDEGSCVAIANEVGTAKIANPFSAGDISYVESPYSYNSITDFQDNIRSIRNVWYGSTNGSAADVSFKKFFDNVGQSAVNTSVVNAFENAIQKIGAMPAPFVKYCSTIWNIEFTDDEDWNTEE
ncbi:MAG: imelysin [Prevotella sp.]|nr:imelysin [Prevotella sp.]MBQ4294853.1 imelysin [Prevotella sp.]